MHSLLLLCWLLVGTGIRLMNLEFKPPWTDEFATLVFSLGHSFKSVPLDQAISLDTLLQPLHLDPHPRFGAVVQHLLTEDVHPPLYFVLAHWWMHLLPAKQGLISIWWARALPALLGALMIPAGFALGWLFFRSLIVGQVTAALMAVSPFGVFLAQEARHYTLGMVWVMASLACLMVAVRSLQRQATLPVAVVLAWVGVNCLGIATHFFFLLTLLCEALVLAYCWIWDARSGIHPQPERKKTWLRIYAVAAGTIVGGLVWLPVLQTIQSSETTQWIHTSDRWSLLSLINPFFQSLAAWLTMLSLLPVESTFLPVVIASGFCMGVFFLWAIPILKRGIAAQLQENRQPMQVLVGFVGGAIALFFAITYGLGTDLTRGARYNFVYYPAVIVLVAASLFASKSTHHKIHWKAVVIIWLMGLASSLTVVSNLGYQKYYRPDLLVPKISALSHSPVLIATTQKTLVETGELMGLGWEWQRRYPTKDAPTPQFLLARKNCNRKGSQDCPNPKNTLERVLTELPRPLDLWLVNFFTAPGQNDAALPPTISTCVADPQVKSGVYGYAYQLYHCQ